MLSVSSPEVSSVPMTEILPLVEESFAFAPILLPDIAILPVTVSADRFPARLTVSTIKFELTNVTETSPAKSMGRAIVVDILLPACSRSLGVFSELLRTNESTPFTSMEIS